MTIAALNAFTGTEFPLSLLNAVCDPCLEAALDELCERDLLRQVSGPPEPVYRFRHALIQEAVYNSLLGAERRLLHSRAAWALEAAADRVAGAPEQVEQADRRAGDRQDHDPAGDRVAGQHRDRDD